MVARFAKAGPWLKGYLSSHSNMTRKRIATINGVAQPAKAQAGNSNIWYGPGRFQLAPDEALVIEFAPPKAVTWTIQWLTFPWYEPPDIANTATSVTAPGAYVSADGKVRIVLTGRDPGVPNWIDTGDSPDGVIMLRWIWCEEAFPVSSFVVKRDELAARLPADTPSVNREQRLDQQTRRRSHWAGRSR